jgi:hypothetical protein
LKKAVGHADDPATIQSSSKCITVGTGKKKKPNQKDKSLGVGLMINT